MNSCSCPLLASSLAFDADAPVEFDNFLARMLAPDPALRLSATEVLEEPVLRVDLVVQQLAEQRTAAEHEAAEQQRKLEAERERVRQEAAAAAKLLARARDLP